MPWQIILFESARGEKPVEELRIFYAFKERIIYLLHGFRKQTQKTPQKELDTALTRLQSLTKI